MFDFATTTSPLSMERAAVEAGDGAAAFTLFGPLREHDFPAAETCCGRRTSWRTGRHWLARAADADEQAH